MVFQPHRYTRTKRLLREFGPALAGAEEILLTDIYSAGEEPMAGASLDALAAAMRETAGDRLTVVPRLEDLPGEVARRARPGDLVIVMGAGSIGGMAERVVAELDAGRDLVR